MNDKPLISVVIPVYNTLPFLRRCVSSVTAQSYGELEIIIIDDGSTDGSYELCDKLAETDERIRVIHTENNGISAARNRGIEASSGAYITLLDSDDFIYKDMYEIMLGRIIEDKSEMAVCNRLRVGDGDVKGYLKDAEFPLKNEVLTRDEIFEKLSSAGFNRYGYVTGTLCKKEIFNEIRFPEGKIHEDVFTVHLIYDKCKKISCVQYAMYYWYDNSQSITNTYSRARFDVLDGYLERFGFFMNKGMTGYAAYAFEGFIWNFNDLRNRFYSEHEEMFLLYKKKYKSAYRRLLRTLDKSAFNKKYYRFYKERI